MKKIINGKLYNTETAKEVGQYWNGYDCENDFYEKEKLYLKKTGEWFLYGEGGAVSCYGVEYGTTYIGSSVIIPFTIGEANLQLLCT